MPTLVEATAPLYPRKVPFALYVVKSSLTYKPHVKAPRPARISFPIAILTNYCRSSHPSRCKNPSAIFP